MSTVLNLGDKLTYVANWEGEDNCVLCNKPVSDKALWLLTDQNDVLITEAEYNSGDNYAVPVGSTCAKKIGQGVAAAW